MCALLSLNHNLTACAGAEVHLKQDGSYDVRLLKLSLNKKLIEIGTKKRYSDSSAKVIMDSLAEPLAITITGKGVLIKKTNRLDVVSEGSLQHLFPTFKLAEFYMQHFPAGEHSYISIIRKETADSVIEAFKKQGVEVYMLSLGPFVVDQVIPQINSYEGVLKFDGHQVTLNADKEWSAYAYDAGIQSAFSLKIDIEKMPEEFLLAYATAFQLILNDKLELIEVDSEQISGKLSELMAKQKFKKYGSLALFFFFGLLMLNFLVLSAYNSYNQELMSKAGQQSYIYENRQKLEEEVKGKENLVKKLGWNKGYRYAYLCDQIGSSVPKEVLLDELLINSLSGGSSGLIKEVQLETGRILIKGQTSSIYAINNWIYDLQQKSWVKNVQLEKYTADDQKQAQVFTILLKY
nr:PilN domain-containing protein [Pedobacter panaciterrae]